MKMPDVIKEAIQSPLPEPDVTPLEEPAKRKRSTKSKSKK